MCGEEPVQRRRADLFFALDEHAHVARQRAGTRKPRTNRECVRDGAGFVVGGAAPVEPTVPLVGDERVARPIRDDAGRLHVVMRIQQNGGRARGCVHPFADHERLRTFDAGDAHVFQPVRTQ